MPEIDSANISELMPELLLTLVVSDYDLAERFYCEVLGLFVRGIQTFLVLKSDSKFAFQMEKPSSDLMRDSIGRQAGDGFLLCLQIPDCELMLPTLKAADVRIFPPEGAAGWKGDEIFRLPWGNQIHCADPFGNKLSLFSS